MLQRLMMSGHNIKNIFRAAAAAVVAAAVLLAAIPAQGAQAQGTQTQEQGLLSQAQEQGVQAQEQGAQAQWVQTQTRSRAGHWDAASARERAAVTAYRSTSGYDVELNAPASLTASFTGGALARLTWGSVSGARTYEVQYSTNNSTWRKGLPSITSRTSLTLRKLVRSGTYYFRVRARNNTRRRMSDWAISGPVTKPSTVLAAPSGLTAAFTDRSTIRVTWSSVASASSYQLQYSSNNQRWSYENPLTIKQTNFTSRGMTKYDTYYYRVRAKNSYGRYSPWSTSVRCVKKAAAPLAAPSSLSAVFTGDTAARVSWSSVAGAGSYTVQYSRNNYDWYVTGASVTSSTSVTFNNLSDYGTYYFRVRTNAPAVSGSQYQDVAPSGWKYSGPVEKPVPKPVYAPQNLTASFVSADTALLSWSAVTGASYYDIQYSSDNRNWYDENPATTYSVTYLSTNLNRYNTYYFRVRARAADTSSGYGGSGRYSDWAYSGACVKAAQPSQPSQPTLSAPATLTASFVDQTSALLSWAAVTGASSYDVQYSQDNYNWYDENPSATTATTFLSSNLYSYDTYYFRVRARDASGRYSEWKYASCAKAAAAPTLSVSWRNWDVGHANAAEQDLTITTNTNWSAAGAPSWIKLGSAAGTGTQTVRVSVELNTGSASRAGTFTIEAGGLKETITVTQPSK